MQEIDAFVNTAKEIVTEREEFWRKHTDRDYGDLLRYLLILSIFPAAGIFLLYSVTGYAIPFFGMMRFSIFYGIQGAVYTYIISIVGPFITGFLMSIIAEGLKYGGDMLKFSNLAVYSITPFLLAQVLVFIPFLGGLIVFLGGVFSLYLVWLGLKEYLKFSQERALVLLVVYLVVVFIIRLAIGSAGYRMI